MVSLMKLFRIVIITLNGLFITFFFKASSPRGEREIENYNINYYILYSLLNYSLPRLLLYYT